MTILPPDQGSAANRRPRFPLGGPSEFNCRRGALPAVPVIGEARR